MSFINRVLLKLKREEIEKGRVLLQGMTTEDVLRIVSKNCWKSNVQYFVIVNTEEILMIILMGQKEKNFFTYHKKNSISLREYFLFNTLFHQYYCKKGIYLTSGAFDRKITNLQKQQKTRAVELIDGEELLKQILNPFEKAREAFKEQNLNFYRFLPI